MTKILMWKPLEVIVNTVWQRYVFWKVNMSWAKDNIVDILEAWQYDFDYKAIDNYFDSLYKLQLKAEDLDDDLAWRVDLITEIQSKTQRFLDTIK